MKCSYTQKDILPLSSSFRCKLERTVEHQLCIFFLWRACVRFLRSPITCMMKQHRTERDNGRCVMTDKTVGDFHWVESFTIILSQHYSVCISCHYFNHITSQFQHQIHVCCVFPCKRSRIVVMCFVCTTEHVCVVCYDRWCLYAGVSLWGF